VASIIDKHFDTIFLSLPELKSSKAKKPAYIKPKVQFQKRIITERLLDPKNHLVDQILKRFQDRVLKKTDTLLKTHFQHIRDLLGKYSASLHIETPINYRVNNAGLAQRADIEKYLSTL
jgi:hypothetical protein